MKKTNRIFAMLLAAVMVVGMMPLTALAAPSDTAYCGYEEHTHSDACQKRLTCTVTEHTHSDECQKECNIEAHKHGDDCKDLNCNNTDEGHTHTDECYTLNCEKMEHSHSADCTKTCDITPHQHTDSCYETVVCELHVHTDDCFVAPTMSTTINDTEFVVGVPAEFTFSTVANGAAGRMVVGTSNFSDASAISKLEYYEVKDGKWYELSGDFGPSTGFPMSNATSKFRVTFNKAGEYTFTASMKLAGTDEILCSTQAKANVTEPLERFTVTDETPDSAGGVLQAEEFVMQGSDLVVTVVPDDGYHLEKLLVNNVDKTADVEDLQYTIENVQANVVLKATFAQDVTVTDIKSVEIKTQTPKIGSTPSAYASAVTSDPEKAMAVKDTTLLWLTNSDASDTDLSKWTAVDVANDKFEADASYIAVVMMNVPETYKLADDVVVKLNNKVVELTTYNDKPAVMCNFGKLTVDPVVVTDIKVTVTAPAIDATPATTVTVVTTPANAVKNPTIDWYYNADLKAEVGDDGWVKMTSKDKFEAGKLYAADIGMIFAENTEADEDMTASVNGKSTDLIGFSGTDVFVAYVFDVLEPDYSIVNGANSNWKDNGKEGLAFRSDAEFAKFDSVKVDDKTVDPKNYTAKEGSTIVTLAPEFLKTLKAGEHTLEIVSKDGSASTKFTIEHVHVLKKVEAKKETCTEKGNKEYYECACGKFFADDKAATEIVDKTSVEIKAAGHKAEEKWTFDGKQHWHKCSVCGKAADEKADHKYETTSEGKTGTVCTVCKYDSENPKTGDMSPVGVVAAILTLAILGTAAVCGKMYWDKKHSN